MSALTLFRTCLLVCSLVISQPLQGFARTATERDGQHDFDWEVGAWKAHLSRLQHPLTGSKIWIDFDGTSVVRKIWNGRANLGELETDSPTGHIEGLTLRLYNPQTHQWNIHWANSGDGTLGEAMVGEFENGRGEFFDQETFNGRAIKVRFVFSDITPRSFRFEQAFSDDGGKTWEVNWIATFTRATEGSAGARRGPLQPPARPGRGR
jgi:hypothetical protein